MNYEDLIRRRMTVRHAIYRDGTPIVVVLRQVWEEDLWESQLRWAAIDQSDSKAVRAADRELIVAAYDHCEDEAGATIDLDFPTVVDCLTSAERVDMAAAAWALSQKAPEAPSSAPRSRKIRG